MKYQTIDQVQAELNRHPLNWLGQLVDRYWLDRWHWTSKRAGNQYMFYRCKSCTSLVTWKHISRDGGCKCGSARVSPTIPLFTEKLRLLFLPWTV